MNLPFSTELKGKKTYFVEKILNCRRKQESLDNFIAECFYTGKHSGKYELNRYALATCLPKLHTFREDEKNRWKAGISIHPFINNRTKKMLQFAPQFPCKSTQRVIITVNDKIKSVYVDGKIYACLHSDLASKPQVRDRALLTVMAQNDGFETLEGFFDYFAPRFSGKIIHFTDLKY